MRERPSRILNRRRAQVILQSDSGSSEFPFNYLDELVLLSDRPAEPMGIYMELRLEGRLDGRGYAVPCARQPHSIP